MKHVATDGSLKDCKATQRACPRGEHYTEDTYRDVTNNLIHSQKHLSLWLLLKEQRNQQTPPLTVKDSSGNKLIITPGVIDENAEKYYLYGQCVALATMLAKKVNGVVRIGWEHNGELIHAWVVKNEHKIDIIGVEDADRFEENLEYGYALDAEAEGGYSELSYQDYTPEEAQELLSEPEKFKLLPQRYDIAEKFAETIYRNMLKDN